MPAAETPRNWAGLKVILATALVYTLLFVLTMFPRSPETEAQAAAYFSPQEIENGLRFAFQRRLVLWASTAVQLAFLFVMVFSGYARKLADSCARVVPFPRAPASGILTARVRLLRTLHWLTVLLLVGAFCFVVEELLMLPFRLARFALLRSWGLTERGVLDWLNDYGKSLGLAALMGAVLLIGLYLLIRLFPRWWWALAAAASILLGILYAYLLPVVINPLFNTFTPLRDPYLKERVRALAAAAGVPIEEVLVMDASRQGKHTNAYFTGFGSTRRVVLYDTLLRPLQALPPRTVTSLIGFLASPSSRTIAGAVVLEHQHQVNNEVANLESILAHELGHWQHDHIVKGLALAGVGAFVGLFVLAWLLRRAVGRKPFDLSSPSDPAGVPLLLLLSVLGGWLVGPVENAISREFETQADRVALELTNHPAAFIEAEKRLARENLSNVAPTPFAVWLFATHPTTVERIRMAKEWQRK